MKWLCWGGLLGLMLLEIALVYFIMPMPGSQRMRSIELAYAIHSWRWVLRGLLAVMLLAGLRSVWQPTGRARWLLVPSVLVVMAIAYVFNFRMAADHMFLQPRTLIMRPASANTVAGDR